MTNHALTLISLALFGLLHGCASPKVAFGNEASVQIEGMDRLNEKEGFELANQHCQKFGRVARIHLDQGHRVTFDCIKP